MWYEYQFHCSESLMTLFPKPEFYDKFYSFKKRLLPILDNYSINDFLILDEGRFFLLRVELDDSTAERLKGDLDNLVNDSLDFDNVTRHTWSPTDDARGRIRGAGQRATQMRIPNVPEGGWKIDAWCEGNWVAKPDNLDQKTEKFAKFMSKVVGKFTRAYLQEIDERVDDRWLLSVFIHLLLHSISEQRFEKETRHFPWI